MTSSERGRESKGGHSLGGPISLASARGWLTDLRRAPGGGRPDTEHEVAVTRIVILCGVLAWSVLRAPSIVVGLGSLTSALSLAALVVAVVLRADVVRHPGVWPVRRHLSVIGDQVFLCLIMGLAGEQAVWLLPALLVVCVSAALRYGRTYTLAASAAGALGVVLLFLLHKPFWHQAPMLILSWLIALVWVPAYVSVLGTRLEAQSEAYRQRARKMRKAALQDQLTGLTNRTYFQRILERAIQLAQPGDRCEGFAILYCDLDGFKAVNDTHGHHIGDLLLIEVGATLARCVRDTDTVARMGGDEFAIYLKGIRDTDIARRIGADIVARVKAIGRVDGRPVNVSCSVGITLVAAPIAEGEYMERLLSRADEAMYQAKRAGKNQFYLQWA